MLLRMWRVWGKGGRGGRVTLCVCVCVCVFFSVDSQSTNCRITVRNVTMGCKDRLAQSIIKPPPTPLKKNSVFSPLFAASNEASREVNRPTTMDSFHSSSSGYRGCVLISNNKRCSWVLPVFSVTKHSWLTGRGWGLDSTSANASTMHFITCRHTQQLSNSFPLLYFCPANKQINRRYAWLVLYPL